MVNTATLSQALFQNIVAFVNEGVNEGITKWVLLGLFIIIFFVFLIILITSAYHLHRYTVTKTHAIKTEFVYLAVSFVPIVVMLSILLSY